jgi:hypothetical protein
MMRVTLTVDIDVPMVMPLFATTILHTRSSMRRNADATMADSFVYPINALYHVPRFHLSKVLPARLSLIIMLLSPLLLFPNQLYVWKQNCVVARGVLSTVMSGVVIEGICPSDCPDPLVPDEVCLEVGNFGQCISGEPLVCDDTRYAFPYEKACDCNDRGIAKCVFHSCPVSCPERQPRVGDACVGYFADPCTYGQLCCPGPGGRCVPDTQCDCLESSRFHCEDFTTYASLPCPAVCPLIPPKTNDPCDMDQRYHCLYGDPLPCNDDDGYAIYDTQCWCHHKDDEDDARGTFVCNSYRCPPVICAELPPVHGTTCSSFVGGTW